QLVLHDSSSKRPSDWVQMVYTALEAGINSFEIAGRGAGLVDGFGEAIRAVDRNLVFVAWRLGWTTSKGGAPERDLSAEGIARTTEPAIARPGIGYVDAAVLDDPDSDELSAQAMDTLRRLKDMGRIRMIGVSGSNDCTAAYISSRNFDLVSTSF